MAIDPERIKILLQATIEPQDPATFHSHESDIDRTPMFSIGSSTAGDQRRRAGFWSYEIRRAKLSTLDKAPTAILEKPAGHPLARSA